MGASPHAIHQVQDFKRGSSFSANQLNAVLAAVQGQANVGAGFQQMEIEEFLGIITDSGPSAEPDYTDERYWIKSAYCSTPDNTTPADDTANVIFSPKENNTDAPPAWGQQSFTVTATHLNQAASQTDPSTTNPDWVNTGGHFLAPGTLVHVFGVFDSQWPAIKHYYFICEKRRYCQAQEDWDGHSPLSVLDIGPILDSSGTPQNVATTAYNVNVVGCGSVSANDILEVQEMVETDGGDPPTMTPVVMARTSIAYGIPATAANYPDTGNEVDNPPATPYDNIITLIKTNASGVAILDNDGNQQLVTVWRNSNLEVLYIDLDQWSALSTSGYPILAYVLTAQPLNSHPSFGYQPCGYLLSGEPGFWTDLYVPSTDGDAVLISDPAGSPVQIASTTSTDATGDPAVAGRNVLVCGAMYLTKTHSVISGYAQTGTTQWRPWMVIDTTKFPSDHKVIVNDADSAPDYLDAKITTDPGDGTHQWLKHGVTSDGHYELLTHTTWDSDHVTAGSSVAVCDISDSPSGSIIKTSAPTDGSPYITFTPTTDEFDACHHSLLGGADEEGKGTPKYIVLTSDHKVAIDATDQADGNAGYLDSKVSIDGVSLASASHNWLRKSIQTLGGVEVELFEHDVWDSDNATLSTDATVVGAINAGGGASLSDTVPSGPYLSYVDVQSKVDTNSHGQIEPVTGTTKYIALPFGTSDNATELDSGTDDSANTDDWDITAQTPGSNGVIFTPIRLAWSGNPGDPVHQYTRQMTFDSQGRLVKVAAEDQSDAFATGPCGDSGDD